MITGQGILRSVRSAATSSRTCYMIVPVRADDSFHISSSSALWRISRAICLGRYRPHPIVVKPMGLAPGSRAFPHDTTLRNCLSRQDLKAKLQLGCLTGFHATSVPHVWGGAGNTRWAVLCFDALDGVAQTLGYRLLPCTIHRSCSAGYSLITRAVGNRVSEAALAYHGHGPPQMSRPGLRSVPSDDWHDMLLV